MFAGHPQTPDVVYIADALNQEEPKTPAPSPYKIHHREIEHKRQALIASLPEDMDPIDIEAFFDKASDHAVELVKLELGGISAADLQPSDISKSMPTTGQDPMQRFQSPESHADDPVGWRLHGRHPYQFLPYRKDLRATSRTSLDSRRRRRQHSLAPTSHSTLKTSRSNPPTEASTAATNYTL
ncbi:hypothetical protein ABW19_dt0206656 [Dactylella cylindrospora]|nr:hypothetical protein ABW19_dt0206656 [Dactylella cylindrospora]